MVAEIEQAAGGGDLPGVASVPEGADELLDITGAL